jgi:3-methyladenine DNA glycosylase Tag
MNRLQAAASAAVLAFRNAWREFDPDRVAAERYVEKLAARQEKLSESFASLNESDQHFVQSFTNNLPTRPQRADAERFMEIVRSMSQEAQAHVMREICSKHPELVTVPAFAKWTRENLALVASFKHVRTIPIE